VRDRRRTERRRIHDEHGYIGAGRWLLAVLKPACTVGRTTRGPPQHLGIETPMHGPLRRWLWNSESSQKSRPDPRRNPGVDAGHWADHTMFSIVYGALDERPAYRQ
jgi:hypothetical protein